MSKALQSAYNKGAAAADAGKNLSDCPYQDKRKWDGRLTWSRAFQSAWFDGFNDRKQMPITAYYSEKSRPGQPNR